MSDSQRPLTKVRFEHGFIPELGMHCITSPDIKGFTSSSSFGFLGAAHAPPSR
jgi:hypothetical protein